MSKPYREMTEAEMLAWGSAESEARKADLSIRTAEGLKAAQANAEKRRKLIGASMSQAAVMVSRAHGKARTDAWRAERGAA